MTSASLKTIWGMWWANKTGFLFLTTSCLLQVNSKRLILRLIYQQARRCNDAQWKSSPESYLLLLIIAVNFSYLFPSQRKEQGLSTSMEFLSIKQQAGTKEIFSDTSVFERHSISHLFFFFFILNWINCLGLGNWGVPRHWGSSNLYTLPWTTWLCPPLSPIWSKEQNAFPSLQLVQNEKRSDFHPISFSSFILIITTKSTEIIIFTMMNVQLVFPI